MTTVERARADVLAADGGCVASLCDPNAGPCRDGIGTYWNGRMGPAGCEVDRVREHPTMGKAPSHTDRTRMVSLCPGHHRGVGTQAGSQWATSHRPELRKYLAVRNGTLGW